MGLSSGEVWWAVPDPGLETVVGREQAGRRPVVIVSGDLYHEAVTTLALAVPVTTTNRGWPNHVPLIGNLRLSEPSFAMTEQVRAVSRDRLTARAGYVSEACLAGIRGWIADYLVY